MFVLVQMKDNNKALYLQERRVYCEKSALASALFLEYTLRAFTSWKSAQWCNNGGGSKQVHMHVRCYTIEQHTSGKCVY